jgi:hypothetical protein
MGRLREVAAGLGAEDSVAAARLAHAVGAIRAPVGGTLDPLNVFREVVVLAERPSPRTPRRLFALVAGVGLVVGAVATTALSAGARLPQPQSLPEVAGVFVTHPQSGADAEWPSQQPALNAAWGDWADRHWAAR